MPSARLGFPPGRPLAFIVLLCVVCGVCGFVSPLPPGLDLRISGRVSRGSISHKLYSVTQGPLGASAGKGRSRARGARMVFGWEGYPDSGKKDNGLCGIFPRSKTTNDPTRSAFTSCLGLEHV